MKGIFLGLMIVLVGCSLLALVPHNVNDKHISSDKPWFVLEKPEYPTTVEKLKKDCTCP